MAYPNRGLLKAAMGHYLTESARTALEALEPSDGVVEMGPGRQMPVVGPNQILDMPLFAKMPFLPGSNTMFYTTNLGEKLYQPSATFDLSDPYCKVMAPQYKSLHDPHLRAYYKRKDNLRRLRKAGRITDKNKVVCTLKEFNEYRQYLTSLKLEFEKNYIREQKMLEKQITKLQDGRSLPEGVDTSKYRDWLLKEERPTIQEQENVMRNRYLELINQELEKLEQLAEENQRLASAQDDKKKQGLEKRKQLLLRKKMEEEWRKKEVMLLMKIGADVKREARIEEQRRKSKEDKLKRKQAMLEKKMAHHLRKLQERFQREGLVPPSSIFPEDTLEDQGPDPKRQASLPKKPPGGSAKSFEGEKKSSSRTDSIDLDFLKGKKSGFILDTSSHMEQETLKDAESIVEPESIAEPESQLSQVTLPKAGKSQTRSRQSLGPKHSWDASQSKGNLEQRKAVQSDKSLTKKPSRDSEHGESILPSSKVSFTSAKEEVTMTFSGSNQVTAMGFGEGSNTSKGEEGITSACGSAGSKTSFGGTTVGGAGSKTTSGAPGGCDSKTTCGGPGGCGSSKSSCGGPGGCGSSKSSCGGPGGCGSSKSSCGGPGGCGSSKSSCGGPGGCGSSKSSCGGPGGCGSSKSSCGGPGGCGSSKSSCGGPGGCGSKGSCCGSNGCGSKSSCCSLGRCGSKTSCCGLGRCGSKTSCCGSGMCGSKTSCCGSGRCGSKTSCCGSVEDGSKASCCGSGGCCSQSGKGIGGYDSSGSSRHGNSSRTGKGLLSVSAGADTMHPSTVQVTTQTAMSSTVSQNTASEISSKAKHKKRATFLGEADGHSKDRSSSKKRRIDRSKTEHRASISQDNEDSESSYSAYLHRLLSTSDQSAIRESLKGKVSASELNSIIQNIMTWVVSAVTSILYPALTKFEERVRTKAYTISEESVLSSDNSSSCSTCNEDLPETYGSLHATSTRKASCTDTSMKPTTSSPSDVQTTLGKPSSKSSIASFTKSTYVSVEADPFKGIFKRGKTAVFLSPNKLNGPFSTTSSMRSSKSDSQICLQQKGTQEAPEKLVVTHHFRHRRAPLKGGLLSKTETMTTDTEGVLLGGGEYKPSHGSRDPGETICLRDLRSVLDDLKSHLTHTTASVLEDAFKRILGDLGFSTCSVTPSMDVLLEAISESLLGCSPGGLPGSTSISRVASFVASDLVEKVLNTLHSTAQKKYFETISKDEFSTGCKAMCIVASGKHPAPDPSAWRARISLSFEAVYGIAEEIVHAITEKLKVFAICSRTKLSQFELFGKIKAFGIPLEQVCAAIPPHTVESDAANTIVKDTIRRIVSKTVQSSETHIIQCVEEMITSILCYIQRQVGQEGILPAKESSILLQLINDVFNDLSVENLRILSPSGKSRASPDAPVCTETQTKQGPVTITTLHMSEKLLRKPFPLVTVPGMILFSETEKQGREKRGPDGSKGRRVVGMEETIEKAKSECFGMESRHRSKPGPKSLQGDVSEPRVGSLDGFVQDAIFCSFGEQSTAKTPGTEQPTTDGGWTLELALKKLEEDFKEGEHCPVIQIVRNLLTDVFQHIWAEHPIWPPAAPPPSLTQMGITKPEEVPPPKGQTGSPVMVCEADVVMLTGDLVKTVFQKLSSATVPDAPEARSRRSNLVFNDTCSSNRTAETVKVPPSVHFRSPETSFESATTKDSSSEEPPRPRQPDLRNLPSKSELVSDLVQVLIEKLEAFITSKVESQFCSEIQNLKTSTSANFPASIHQDLRQFLATHQGSLPSCLEDMFNSYQNLLAAEKEKSDISLPFSYSNLKTYAQEVAKRMLKSLKHGLDKEVEKILISPIIFSESIAASQIVSMVLAIFSSHERLTEAQRKESVLEKLFRKNPAYKRDIQGQIHNTVDVFLNEIYQTILLEFGNSSLASGLDKCPSPRVGESYGLKTGGSQDHRKKGPTRSCVAQSDVSVVSSDLVDVMLEDLRSGLAAGLSTKGALSGQLQSLLYDLLHKAVQPLKHLIGKHHTQASSKTEKAHGKMMSGHDTKEASGGREFSPACLTKSLVNNILRRLELFAEDKMESELTWQEKQPLPDGRYSGSPSGQVTTEAKIGTCREKAKVAVQSSQCNLRLCAEKLTCTLLKLFQKDLEQEMLSCQNILPYEENASANEIVNDLLKILSVQIALTENEIQKRVVKRIFKRGKKELKGGAPLLARVEDVLHHLTQRIIGDLGHLPSFQNESLFLSSDSKSSTYGTTEAGSQAGNVAGEIVDGVLDKMYTVVVDTLFSSGTSKPEVEASKKDPCQAAGTSGKSDIQKLTLALSQLQPPPRTLGEELVQNVLNKIATFAASSLEEVLPLTLKQKTHTAFQYDLQAGDGTACRPRMFLDDSDNSLMRVTLTRSDLTVYAKDVVNKVLGSIIDDLRNEDYHRAILRINTLSSEQISIASSLVHSVVQDLHVDDGLVSHLHKQASTRRHRLDSLPSTQMYFQWESTTRDGRVKCNSLFYEDFAAYLRQVLPKEGILRDIFEQQPLTDANINENLKMLQVSESIVSEVFMRIRDLEPSVCILKRTSGELSERLFCCGFKRAEPPGLFHSDSQAEIGSVARDIVASVFENVHRCLVCSFPRAQERDGFWGKKDWTLARGCGRPPKYRFTQPDFPFYNISLKGSSDIIDKIAKETVECILLMLETFVARHFRRDFKCNFLEIVKFPLESLTFAQLTRSLDSLSTQVRSVTEQTGETFRLQVGVMEKGGGLPTLGSVQSFLDTSKVGNNITKECVETAIRQVQVLHSELSVYANNAVSGILEIIKRTLDRELLHKEANLFSSSSESLALSETISAMLDRCNESLTEITSELMVENLHLEMGGRARPKDKSLLQDYVATPGVKTTTKRYRRIDTKDTFPPINVPGMVIYSEEETEVREEAPSKFPSVMKFSEWGARCRPERHKGMPSRSRPPGRRRQDQTTSRLKPDWLEEDWLPRQTSIPEGSILEKLFKKAAEVEGLARFPGPASKAGHGHPFSQSPPLPGPGGTCFSELCPLKLGHTAETIVNTLLCEFGLEDDSAVHTGHYEEHGQRFPLKDRPPPVLGTTEPQQKRSSLLNLWEKRMGSMWGEDGCYIPRDGNTLLSRWESKHCLFEDLAPEQLMGCMSLPDPYEIQLLANHIVLSVIKELLSLQPRESMDSLPTWRQELLQSESRWLQERIWRSTYQSSSWKPSSCLDLCWEPLTQAVVSSLLSSIVDPSGRQKIQSELFEGSLLNVNCPEHGLKGSQGSSTNLNELASHISDGILVILREKNILQETTTRKRFSGRKVKSIQVPPLCLADFDDVYQPLVKEVDTLLSLEFGAQSKFGSRVKAGRVPSPHQQVVPRPISGASRGDCRGPGDLKGMSCLSMMGPLAQKSQRLSCVASNLDHFIRGLKTSESKQLVNKVLRIILDSLWPSQSQSGFVGPYPEAASRNVMPYRDADLFSRRPVFSSSTCPHVNRLGNNVLGSNLGLSPKSVVLLDVVSEKLIRTLLDKCLMTEQFTGNFAFDEFPEDEQIGDIRKCLSDDGFLEHPGRDINAHKVESSSSVYSYNIKYEEEAEEEVEAPPVSYESALDVLAHTLVKPVMTELSLSVECQGYPKTYSKKSVGFMYPSSRKAHRPPSGRRHMRHGRGESYSSFYRTRRPEPLVPISRRQPYRRSMRGKDRSVLDSAVQHRTFSGRTGIPPAGGKSYSSTTSRKSYHREMVCTAGHGDHPDFSTIYSATFLEEVISQLLIKIFSSLRSKYDSESCIDLNEMNRLFVDSLVENLNRAGVGVLPRAEEKAHLPQVDGQTVQRVVDSILQEFGFQLAANTARGRDIEALARQGAEVILMEILDYQLPPPLCRRLPQSAFKPIKAEKIICRIEGCICFPAVPRKRKRQPPPTYITVLSQKYLERVINRLVAQLFPPCDSDSIFAPEQVKGELGAINPDELCSYMMKEVMKSISKHKIWVARKDDQCRLHSKKETQRMVDSVYENMLKKSGSQLAMQKDVTSRTNSFVDSMTSFIIQEITRHHLQTFLSKEEYPPGTPDPDTLSENIVRTVLNSISETPGSCAGVFPVKFLEEMVSRVLSKILGTSMDKKAMDKGQPEDELGKVVKKLASSINLQFAKTAGPQESSKGEEQSLAAPLTAVMDDVIDSVCKKISREREVTPPEDLGSPRDKAVFETVKRLIGKGISDYLLHPLFSGDFPSRVSPCEDFTAGDEFQETQEETEHHSPFSTFLSSGFLKDIIAGLLSKIFPSPPSRESRYDAEAKRLPSDSDLRKLSAQLLDDVRMKLLKHEIRVTKDAPLEQYEYSEEDVQYMTDSLCSKIIQKSGSLEAVQTEVRKKSNSLIDRIAGFLVGDLLQMHVQPFVSEPEVPTWDRGDSMRGMEVCRATIKPWDPRQAVQEKRGSPTPSHNLVQIINELFSNISNRFSDVPFGAPGDNLEDTAIRVAKSVANVLSRSRLCVQENPVEDLGSCPPERQDLAAWKLPDKVSLGLFSDDGSLTCQMPTLTFEEPAEHPLQAVDTPNLAEAMCLIQKRLMIGPAGPMARPAVPYTTVLSYPVLETIVDRLLCRIFPESKESNFGLEQREKLAQLKKGIMVAVLKQAIWISTYGTDTGISEQAMENMVESVYCDVLHEVLLQQPLQGDKESLSNLYVTKIACFIVNEMFKYHLQTVASEEDQPPPAVPIRELPASHVTVFPCRFLEEMLGQLLVKIFPDPQRIAAEAGSLIDFTEEDFMEMVMNLKSYVLTEISAHEIKLENVSSRIPDMDQETEEDIVGSVYNRILETSTSQRNLQESLFGPGNSTVCQLANLLIREILNFHLHPFLSGGSNASSGEATPHQQERQPFSDHIYSAMFLEDVVVAFFCKMLSSPDILEYSKEVKTSESEMRDMVSELVNALVNEFKALEVKVIQSEEEDLPFPQVEAEEVVEISNSIYEKVAQEFGSEIDIFQAFQNEGLLLAERLAPLILSRISGYQFQPLFTGDTSSYLFSFLEAETIIDRVETILPETTSPPASGGVFKEMFSKIVQKMFPSWVPQRSEEELETESRASPQEPRKEEPAFEADHGFQSLVENICKTICPKSRPGERKYRSSTAEGIADSRTVESPSPPSQPLPSTRLSPIPAGWTVHRVKLGDAELQPAQPAQPAQPVQGAQGAQGDGRGNVYSSSFLKDIFSGLVSKLLSSTASVCLLEEKKGESESEPPVKTLVESILKAFAMSPVKVMKVPKEAAHEAAPPVDQKEIAKIIHSSLCGILKDRVGGTPICIDKESASALAEKLASSIKKEILGYQIQETPAKSSQHPLSKPFELGEMARKILTEVREKNKPSQPTRQEPLLVSQRFIHDVLDALLTNIIPLPADGVASAGSEDKFAEFDFIHMKLLGTVMAEIGKNANVQYLERCQPNPEASQAITNSIYENLLPEFGDVSALEKCIKAGCAILFERIADCVIKEISGEQTQAYFAEELNQQQEAEAEGSLPDDYRAKPSEDETALQSHLKGLSSIVLEEVAAKLLAKMFHSIPMENIESSSIAAMREVAKKILDSLQGIISKKKLRVWQEEDMEDLGLEDSRTVGEVVDSVYTDIIKHSGSETSLYDELTNENEDFVKRVACVMVSEISRHDFQPYSDSDEDLGPPSSDIKLETDKIIEKFLNDMETEKAKKEQSTSMNPTVPVVVMEEILSRFLTKVVLAQQELASSFQKTWSKTEVNDMADELKISVEKEMLRKRITLVVPEDKLNQEDEEKVDRVVHAVYSNVLEISGSRHEMCKDMTTTKIIFPEQVASIIINEVSSSSNPFSENTENETLSAMELDRIVSKVLARVSSQTGTQEDEGDEDEEEGSLSDISAQPFVAEDAILSDSEELPVKIVPYIGHKPLKIDPEIIAEHLAVLSIKTEPLEKLEKACLSKIGMSLMELRRASASGKNLPTDMEVEPHDPHKKKERRPSLDRAGRLDVKPREAVCRNSFQSLTKPDITRVELLRDVTSKQDLIVRLVAHDINDPYHKHHLYDPEDEERVLREDRSFFFNVPPPMSAQDEDKVSEQLPPEPQLPKTASSTHRRRTLSLDKCCPALTSSSTTTCLIPKEKATMPPVPQIKITTLSRGTSTKTISLSRGTSVQTIVMSRETSTQTIPTEEFMPSTSGTALTTESKEPEKTLEEAAVDMHLTRDTETMSGAFEITSVYQDKKVKDAMSEYTTEDEGEVGKVKTASPEAPAPSTQHRASVLEKVSSALSRVFSRTSTSSKSAPAPD